MICISTWRNSLTHWTCLNNRRITNFMNRLIKEVPLTMKDERNGLTMEEVVCLRSKICSIKFSGGVKQSATSFQRSKKKTLNHDLLKHVLSSGNRIHKKLTQMRSLNRQLFVAQVSKVALSPFDGKEVSLDCDIKSLAYVHLNLQ